MTDETEYPKAYSKENYWGRFARMRQSIIDRYLDGQDYVLWIDADIAFEPDLYRRLVATSAQAVVSPLVLIEGTDTHYDTAGTRPNFERRGRLLAPVRRCSRRSRWAVVSWFPHRFIARSRFRLRPMTIGRPTPSGPRSAREPGVGLSGAVGHRYRHSSCEPSGVRRGFSLSVLPDPTPDLTTAVWRELTEGYIPDQGVAARFRPAQPPDLPDSWEDALLDAGLGSYDDGRMWLWPWDERLQVQGSGRGSIVISTPGSWAGANTYNTLRFPRLQVEVYADIDRDEVAGPFYRSAQKKAQDIWVVVDAFLHRPGHRNMQWGGASGTLRIVSWVRNSGEPDLSEVPDVDGVYRALCSYAVELG